MLHVVKGQYLRIGQVALLLFFLVGLEYLAKSGIVGTITIAPPTEIIATTVELFETGTIVDDLVSTAGVVFVAFAIATPLGIGAGWYLSKHEYLYRVLDPYLITYYSLPIFVFYPVFVGIFGLNRIPIVIIAFLLSSIIIVVNAANGFSQVDAVYWNVSESLRLSRYQAFRHIELPAATPQIFTGLRLGYIYALLGTIASEFILSNSGLGYMVAHSYDNFAVNEMYAAMFIVIAVSLVTNIAMTRMEAHLYSQRGGA